MDSYQSSLEKSDNHQVIWSLSSADNQWSSSCTSTPVKSYTCGFCQKGFSSAQALGGHMNIHRKDRAKLREVYNENLLSLDVAKPLNPEDDIHPLQHHQIPKSSDSLCVKDDIITCSSKELGNFRYTDDDQDSNKLQKVETELDLELRLGPDHQTHEISSASLTKNTRDFF